MHWANFLHIYQPPAQKPYWVKKIAQESYRKLTAGLLNNSEAKITLNVNAVLLELFDAHGCDDILNDLRTLGERKQIEFTGSAKYHPFLPLMPEREIKRQITLNTETCKQFLGDAYQPRGFFSPEMGYSRSVADIVARMEFEWMIVDELAFAKDVGSLSYDTIYTVAGLDDFAVFFRDRATSFRILSADVSMSVFSSEMLVRVLGDRLNEKGYLLTAMDGETFGHHRPGLEDVLFDFYRVPQLTSVHISDLPALYSKRTVIEPRNSTWALMKKDIERNTPYSRWKSEDNEIHLMQWELTDLAITYVEQLEDAGKITPAQRNALDRAIHSDQYWWASAQPWWSIEMIEAGARELRDVILGLDVEEAIKNRAEELYKHILYTCFDWQRSGKVDNLAKLADEDVTQRITAEMPYIPEEEFNSIIENLRKQMLGSADHQEYERAAQLRDRITELESKKTELITPH